MVQRDEELVERMNGGDAEAFEVLYRRYRDWVHRLAWRFTGNQEDALDVLQETFVGPRLPILVFRIPLLVPI
jgi:RNA polymerase sigma-70 factor (ECF subfamily)